MALLDELKKAQEERNSGLSGFFSQLGSQLKLAAGGESMEREQGRLKNQQAASSFLQAIAPQLTGITPEAAQGLIGQAISGDTQGLAQSFNLLKDLQSMNQKQDNLAGIRSGVSNLLTSSGKQLQPADVQLINDVLQSDPKAALNLANSALGRARTDQEKRQVAKESLLQEQIKQIGSQEELQNIIKALPENTNLSDIEELKKLGLSTDQAASVANAAKSAPKKNQTIFGIPLPFTETQSPEDVLNVINSQQGPSKAELQNELLRSKAQKAGVKLTQPKKQAKPPKTQSTVERKTQDGKIAIFDADTKQFIKYK